MKCSMRIAVLALLALLSVACTNMAQQKNYPTETPMIQIQTNTDLDQLEILPATVGQRFKNLDRCIRQATGDSTWKHVPYREIGNSFEARWCQGAGAQDDCFRNSSTRAVQMITLGTQFYPQSFPPRTYGYTLEADSISADAGFSAYCSLQQGKLGEAEHTTFSFTILLQQMSSKDTLEAALSIGSSQSYQILISGKNPDGIEMAKETTISLSSDQPAESMLSQLLESPQALERIGLEQIDRLQANVEDSILEGNLQACDWGPYTGKGIPPACTARAATEQERQTALAKAQADFAKQRSLLNTHATELYEALQKAFPWKQCWEAEKR